MNELQIFGIGIAVGFLAGFFAFLFSMTVKSKVRKTPGKLKFRLTYMHDKKCDERVWRVYKRKGFRWVKIDETQSSIELGKVFTVFQLEYDLDTMPSKN